MFNEVTAVIFIVSLNEFDERLKDETNGGASINSMKESLNVWKQVINSPWFISTPMILFFNKVVGVYNLELLL